jgi:hypothetical protein
MIGEIPRLMRGRPVVKKPLQRSFSTQPEHASTYPFFQSEID